MRIPFLSSRNTLSTEHRTQELAPSTTAVVFLLVDVSYSMEGPCLCQAKEGCIAFARSAIEQGYLVGVISFGSTATYVHDPIRSLEPLARAIQHMEADGTTDIASALQMAGNCFQDIEPDLATVVVATDGMPDDEDDALREARTLKAHGVSIITIGTHDSDAAFLARIASTNELARVVDQAGFSDALEEASTDLLKIEAPQER